MMDQTERTRVLSDLVKINSVNGNELEVANPITCAACLNNFWVTFSVYVS